MQGSQFLIKEGYFDKMSLIRLLFGKSCAGFYRCGLNAANVFSGTGAKGRIWDSIKEYYDFTGCCLSLLMQSSQSEEGIC